ncbi:hypothetical protein FB567DRAFT_555172 [Paraphoma chrysanthemicola]|uniref:F-box domain-containing protein n=1 Tax=Paraphoma chrysanthemicola TaxID=798071 RepID=A0A8K0QU61_9PLEO|nr:hypothetical protein FB567DRAFT_555172 [Paraphoma chrysanthemicola]
MSAATQLNSSNFLKLPDELLDWVLKYCSSSQTDLRHLCLTCRTLQPIAQQLLFREVRFNVHNCIGKSACKQLLQSLGALATDDADAPSISTTTADNGNTPGTQLLSHIQSVSLQLSCENNCAPIDISLANLLQLATNVRTVSLAVTNIPKKWQSDLHSADIDVSRFPKNSFPEALQLLRAVPSARCSKNLVKLELVLERGKSDEFAWFIQPDMKLTSLTAELTGRGSLWDDVMSPRLAHSQDTLKRLVITEAKEEQGLSRAETSPFDLSDFGCLTEIRIPAGLWFRWGAFGCTHRLIPGHNGYVWDQFDRRPLILHLLPKSLETSSSRFHLPGRHFLRRNTSAQRLAALLPRFAGTCFEDAPGVMEDLRPWPHNNIALDYRMPEELERTFKHAGVKLIMRLRGGQRR